MLLHSYQNDPITNENTPALQDPVQVVHVSFPPLYSICCISGVCIFILRCLQQILQYQGHLSSRQTYHLSSFTSPTHQHKWKQIAYSITLIFLWTQCQTLDVNQVYCKSNDSTTIEAHFSQIVSLSILHSKSKRSMSDHSWLNKIVLLD